MRRCLFAILVLVPASFCIADDWSGEIPNGTVWPSGVVQRVTGFVTIPSGSTLTIQSGAIVKFNLGQGMVVEGTVTANGTSGAPIVMTSDKDDSVGGDTDGDGGPPFRGSWNHMVVASTGTADLTWVNLRYGGDRSYSGVSSTIRLDGGSLLFTNGSVTESDSAGIRAFAANPTITNVDFSNNTGGGIQMDVDSNPTFTGGAFTGNGTNGIEVDGGTLTVNGFWDDPDAVYRVTGYVTVPDGLALTIGPGQRVKFNLGQGLQVAGDLSANGTSTAPVTITSDLDDAIGGDTNNDQGATTAYRGSWNKIGFENTANGNLTWVNLRYGGDTSYSGVTSTIQLNGGNFVFDNGSVTESDSAGIRAFGANPTITDVDFANNDGGGIQMDVDSNPAFSGGSFTGNGTNGIEVDGGTLTVNGFWDDPDAVYRVTGYVTVPEGLGLTIGPGQRVKFNLGQGLQVAGDLSANGTSGAPVTITSDLDDAIGGDTNNDLDATTAYRGSWNKIEVGSTGSANFTWVNLRYGGDGSYSGVSSTLQLAGGSLVYTNGSVTESDTAGIRAFGADPTITDVDFTNNRRGGIQMDVDSNPAFSGGSFTGNGTNGIEVDGGTLTVNGFWDDPDAVYRVTGYVTVPDGLALTIGPGQRVKFNLGQGLQVAGDLSANGTSTAPVTITSDLDDAIGGDTNNDQGATTAYRGSWNKIGFENTANGNLTWVNLRYGGDTSYSGVTSTIQLNGGNFVFDNGSVTESDSAGIRTFGANPTITDVDFANNDGGGIQMDVDSNPTFTGGTFTGNGTNGIQVDGGTLNVDGFWDDPDAVYRVFGYVTVPEGLGLTIGPGQRVKFNLGQGIQVAGDLSANGTSAAPVTITSDLDDAVGGDTNNDLDATTAYRGSWNKIAFESTATGDLTWVNLHYGGDTSYSGVTSTIQLNGGDLTFNNGSVSESDSSGIRTFGANPIISGVAFSNNDEGGIRMDVDSNPAVTGGSFSGNGTNGIQVDGGTLTVNGFWDDPDAVYRLTGNVTVPESLGLTIGPNQVVKPNLGVSVVVEGSLTAEGTIGAPIVFASDLDDEVGGDTNNDGAGTTPYRGSWNRILVQPTGSADIAFAEFKWGGDLSYSGVLGTVQVNGGSLNLANTIITESNSSALIVTDSGSAVISNCILAHSGYGLRAVSSGSASAINCTIDSNSNGAAANDGDLQLTNNIISNGSRVGVEQTGSGSVTVSYSDVYNPSASLGNYSGISDQTGLNGNLSSDPLMGNPAAAVYALLSGSPAIDSGTSDGAPLTDLIGNPRVDDSGIENIGGGMPNYYDMGALERQKGSDPVNLVIDEIEFTPESGEIGDTVTITWTVRNAGNAPAAAPWSDAIFASDDTEWALDDERLEVFEQTLTLLPGESYTESIDVEIPPTLPGTLNFIIRADYRQQVREVDESNDELASVDIDILTLLPDESVTFDLTDENPRRYVRVEVNFDPLATDLTIGLDDSDNLGTNELHVSYERIPMREDAEISATERTSDQTLATGDIVVGNYYVLVEGAALGSSPSEVTVYAQSDGFKVDSISPTSASNNGQATVQINGSALNEAAVVRIMDESVIVAEAISVVDGQESEIFATFDLNQVLPGDYTLEAEQLFEAYDEDDELVIEENMKAVAPQTFEIVTGGGPQVVYDLKGPSAVRAGRMFEYTFNYSNQGTVDAPAPMIVLNVDGNGQLMEPGTTSPSSDAVLVMALSETGPPGILRPGQSGSISLSGRSPTTGNGFVISAGVGLPGMDGPDFSAFLQDVGVSLSGPLGSTAITNFGIQFGNTWNSYYQGLGQFAGTFSAREDLIESVAELTLRTAPTPATGKRARARPIGKGIGGGGNCRDVEFETFTFPCIDFDDPRRAPTDANSVAPSPGSKGLSEVSNIRPYCESNYLSLARRLLEDKVTAWNVNFGGNAAALHLNRFLNGDRSDVVYTPDSEFSQYVARTSRQLPRLHDREGTVSVDRVMGERLAQGATPGINERISLGSVQRRPDFKKDALLSLQLRAIGGVRLGAEMTMIVKSIDEEGDLKIFRGVIEYTFADRYDWQGKNFRANAFGRAAYDLGWCAGDPPGSNPLGFNTELNVQVPFTYVETKGCTSKALICPVIVEALTPLTEIVAQIAVFLRTSFDPNDKVGPATAGNGGHVFEGDPLDYTIFFENDPMFATAPAQEVVVIDDLDADLDWETFELGIFAFGDTRIDAPPGRRSFSAEVNSINPDDTPLLVKVSAEIDLLVGRVIWTFESIDPETGGPPNGIETGFLPVNDETHQGEGHVTFRIYPRSDIAFGTELTNSAEIFFDFNDPITTPTTRHVLTDDFIFSSPFEVQN